MMMKMASSIAAALAGAAGIACAAEASAPVTRADVRAELVAAHASGEYGVWNGEDSGSHWLSQQPFVSSLSRSQVAAEAAAARRANAMRETEGEGSPLYAGPDAGERHGAERG